MKKQDWYAVAILFAVGIVVATAIGLKLFLEQKPGAYDEQTLCPNNKQLTAHTVILIDRTDPVTAEQSEALRLMILHYKDQLEQFELLTLSPISGEVPAVPISLFALCNPGGGDTANVWYQNPLFIQREYEERFGAPLSAVIESLMQGETAPQSPIIETIESIARADNFSKQVARRQLVVSSDLLENTPTYSQYKLDNSASDLEAENLKSHIPDLHGVEVTIVYVLRPLLSRQQSPGHIEFWRAFFAAAGASNVEVH